MRLFDTLTLYTHRRMLDAAILVRSSIMLPNGDYSLMIDWYHKDGFSFGLSETVRIKRKEVGNWYAVEFAG
jgi:hypothetical protein